LAETWQVVRRANKYIDETMPWELAKDADKHPALAAVLYNLLETIRICTVMLQPFMPDSCVKVFEQIGAADELRTFDSADNFGGLAKNATVVKGQIIFPRFDVEKELKELSEK
jgi:methionyl-tRNA synthetase